MAPGPLLLSVCLLLCNVAPAWTHSDCEELSVHNLSCFYDLDQRISCEWSGERADVCTVTARNHNVYNLTFFTSYSSRCTLQPTVGAGLRSCTLLFTNNIRSFDVLSLSVSCAAHRTELTLFRPWCHVRLDPPGAPVANGSSLLWAPAHTSSRLQEAPEYELQWIPQHSSWTDGWRTSLKSRCQEQQTCRAELQTPPLLLGRAYSARVRARVTLGGPRTPPSQWSSWGPSLSWESAVGQSDQQQQHGVADGAPGLWTTGAVVGGFGVLILIVFWITRTRWVYVMEMVKGASVPSPAPSVLRTGWQSSPFPRVFLRPVDVISPAELVPVSPKVSQTPPLVPVSPKVSQTPPLVPLDHKPDLSSLSSFSNPMYSELYPSAPPLLPPCSGQSSPLLPELDVLLLLRLAQQCQGAPVNCEYEKVEAVEAVEALEGGSVDSGVGSEEEVSQDSLHPPPGDPGEPPGDPGEPPGDPGEPPGDPGEPPALDERPERTHIMH